MIEPLPLQPALQPKPRPKRPIWVTATGTRITRTKKSRAYLRKRAWVPALPSSR